MGEVYRENTPIFTIIYNWDAVGNISIAKDFKENNNSDKIVIRGNGDNSGLSEVIVAKANLNGREVALLIATCSACAADQNLAGTVNRSIFLEGVDFESLDDWAFRAMYGTESEKKESLIKIIPY